MLGLISNQTIIRDVTFFWCDLLTKGVIVIIFALPKKLVHEN